MSECRYMLDRDTGVYNIICMETGKSFFISKSSYFFDDIEDALRRGSSFEEVESLANTHISYDLKNSRLVYDAGKYQLFLKYGTNETPASALFTEAVVLKVIRSYGTPYYKDVLSEVDQFLGKFTKSPSAEEVVLFKSFPVCKDGFIVFRLKNGKYTNAFYDLKSIEPNSFIWVDIVPQNNIDLDKFHIYQSGSFLDLPTLVKPDEYVKTVNAVERFYCDFYKSESISWDDSVLNPIYKNLNIQMKFMNMACSRFSGLKQNQDFILKCMGRPKMLLTAIFCGACECLQS